MLCINVTYTMPKENRDKFIAELQAENIPGLTRAERGNHAYDFSVPIDNETQVYLREKWEDADCLEEHKAGATIKRLGEIKTKYQMETTITISKYEE